MSCQLRRTLQSFAAELIGRGGLRRFISGLGEPLEDTGFAILERHGVAPALDAASRRRTQEFFEDHSFEKKLQLRRARLQGSVNQDDYHHGRRGRGLAPEAVAAQNCAPQKRRRRNRLFTTLLKMDPKRNSKPISTP